MFPFDVVFLFTLVSSMYAQNTMRAWEVKHVNWYLQGFYLHRQQCPNQID